MAGVLTHMQMGIYSRDPSMMECASVEVYLRGPMEKEYNNINACIISYPIYGRMIGFSMIKKDRININMNFRFE